MPQNVEISLRIPSLRVKREDKDDLETINNSDVRFSKVIEVEAIPKPSTVLKMSISSGETFDCEVVRSDWHHDKNMFVIACRYSKRSITPAENQALMNASDWQIRALI
jgi:hypothetical protein